MPYIASVDQELGEKLASIFQARVVECDQVSHTFFSG